MTTATFIYTGAEEQWVVPAGVVSIAIDAAGAAGGSGGLGARAQATCVVTPGETLYNYVGGAGGKPTAGFNGGAVGGAGAVDTGSAGGGASDVRRGGNALANRIISAGGGGGQGASSGGGPGAGGAGGQNGSNGTGGAGATAPGIGALQGSAGAGGGNGATGALGTGGAGGAGVGSLTYGGGGGGGGAYGGGGGGGVDAGLTGSNGGGGGSSDTTGSGASYTSGYRAGNGTIIFTYTAASAPSAPTLGTITPGNAQLSAAFTAGADGGSAITSYKYSTDNGASYRTRQTGSTASPIVITTLSADGTTPLANGTSYTVLIKAVNAVGDGTASNAVAATPSTTPSAPTALVATGGNQQVSVAFTAGATGGLALTSYKYSTDNGSSYLTRQTGTTASPVLITTLSSDGTTPLTNGVTYQIRLKAVNANGDGTASSAVSGTPEPPPIAIQKSALTMRVGGL